MSAVPSIVSGPCTPSSGYTGAAPTADLLSGTDILLPGESCVIEVTATISSDNSLADDAAPGDFTNTASAVSDRVSGWPSCGRWRWRACGSDRLRPSPRWSAGSSRSGSPVATYGLENSGGLRNAVGGAHGAIRSRVAHSVPRSSEMTQASCLLSEVLPDHWWEF